MAKRLQYRRVLFLALLLGTAFVGLGYRLVDLQVLRHDDLSAKAELNTQREFLLEPRRGDILDAKGNLLATSVFVKTVCADPVLIGNRQADVARILAPLLQTNEVALVQLLTPRVRQNDKGEPITNRFVKLRSKVPVETWDKIQAAMRAIPTPPGVNPKKLIDPQTICYRELREKSVFARPGQMRVYPNQRLAAHLLGYASPVEREIDDLPVTEICGMEGIEAKFDSKLAGVRGWRVTEIDGHHHELVASREQDVEARDGLNVVVTIDSVIQHIVESALADAMEKHSPISVSGIVIRPRTGEILAMATLPNFDPNDPGKAKDDERRNRVITDVAEPGSTFKILVISGAYNDGIVKPTDEFFCENGHFPYAGRVLHDHEPYGILSTEGIITHSSNIGAAKIGIRMGENRLYNYIRDFGLGTKTGIPLPGEIVGIVHPVKNWSKVSIAQIPMGQGIATTRLQMMMVMCALANHGLLMRPMLIDRLEDTDHNVVAQYAPQRLRQVIGDAAAKQMVTALKTVVSPEGTAPKAALEHYTVAGKTGTAQKAENGFYAPGKYFASFIGFFPADNPELCISVTLDEPDVHKGYYGGQIAAPFFKQIAEAAANYLNIRPEDADTTPQPDIVEPSDSRSVRTASARSP